MKNFFRKFALNALLVGAVAACQSNNDVVSPSDDSSLTGFRGGRSENAEVVPNEMLVKFKKRRKFFT